MRSPRPLLQEPDLSPSNSDAAPRPAATDPDDPRFTEAEQFESHDHFIDGVRKGRVRVVNPETVPNRPTSPEPAPLPPRSPEVSLSTKAPASVVHQLRQRYVDTGVTIRNQILVALRKDGIEVEEADLLDERKRPRR